MSSHTPGPYGHAMLVVGNEDFNGPVERRIKCDKCDDFFPVKDSEPGVRVNLATGERSKGPAGMLQFYTCNCGTFLVGIQGMSILK